MHNSTLISILKTFSAEEMKRLEEFVQSPFFNKSRNVIALCNYLSKYHPAFEDKKIEKEKVFAKLFKGETYNDERMRSYISGLLKLVNEFLIISANQTSISTSSITLLKELSKRKLDKQVARKTEQIREQIAENKNSDGLFDTFLLDYTILLDQTQSALNKENTFDKYIQEYNPVESLTAYFLFYYLDVCVRLLIKQGDYNYQLGIDFSDNVYNTLNILVGKNELLLKLKYYQYKLVTASYNMDEAKQLQDMLELVAGKIPPSEILTATSVLISAYNNMIMTGHPEYFRNQFEAYKRLEELGLLLTPEGFIETIIFKNIIESSCKLRELEFLEQFIEKYKTLLPKEDKESIVNYSLARLSFLKKNYTKVLGYLNKAEPITFYQNVFQKIMIIQIFYEQHDETPFLSNLISTKRFLENDADIPVSRKKMYTDFIHFISELFKEMNRMPLNHSNLANIKSAILENNFVVQKEWLLEKVHELK